MDLSWESLYAQFPGLSSPAGCDGFDVDLFFEKNNTTTKKKEDAFIEEYVPDNALIYMEETLDLDKLTELSSLTSNDISETTNMAVETPMDTVEVKSSSIIPVSSSPLYYYDETNNIQCAGNEPYALVKPSRQQVLNSNLNLVQLADILPPDSEEFLQNLLCESEANTFTSSAGEYTELGPLQVEVQESPPPSSPLAVVPNSPAPVQSEVIIPEDESKVVTPNSPKQRILLPKGTIAYTLDLIPGTNTYVVTESRVPVPEDTNAPIEGTLSNNDLLSLGIADISSFPSKMEATSLDTLKVPYPSPAPASPKSESSWSSHQVAYPSSSPSPYSTSGSDTDWVPTTEWEETRGTPYGRKSSKRSPAERKMRKMEQNKTAALRYRKKKHEEFNSSQKERDELRNRNDQLKKTAGNLSTELKYIKKLFKEVCQAKGLIK